MEGVFVSALLTLLLSDTWVTEAEVGEVTIAGRVAGIEGGDNVGEAIFRHERDGLNISFKDSR